FAVLQEHAAEGVIGEQPGEVVDAAVALGLAHNRDDLIGGELPGPDALLQARGVLHALELDLRDFDSHRWFLSRARAVSTRAVEAPRGSLPRPIGRCAGPCRVLPRSKRSRLPG